MADVFLADGTNFNQELVKQDWCRWYRKYAPVGYGTGRVREEFSRGEESLWVDPQPLPPWEWGKQRE